MNIDFDFDFDSHENRIEINRYQKSLQRIPYINFRNINNRNVHPKL